MSARPDLTILPGGASTTLRFRGLGQVCDLDLEFTGPDRPRTVTSVLAACAVPDQDDDAIWGLTLAARIGGLLAIWSASAGADALELQLLCPVSRCAADLEVALPVPTLMEFSQTAENAHALHDGGTTLRRPTGADQRRWRLAGAADPEAEILNSLAPGQAVPGDVAAKEALADRLAEFDPLPCFSVSLTCPECGVESTLPVDLEEVLLGRLAAVQTGLFAEVDRIARRYGWTDDVILSMPATRRARYLHFIDAEEGWM